MNTNTKATIPAINQPWPEQGGIYVGARLIDGALHHIVTSDAEHEIDEATADSAESAEFGEINGHSDWHCGDQEDVMLAFINARERFKKTYYWTRTKRHGWTWAVDFEDGRTDNYHRRSEFRVRPFRSFKLSDD